MYPSGLDIVQCNAHPAFAGCCLPVFAGYRAIFCDRWHISKVNAVPLVNVILTGAVASAGVILLIYLVQKVVICFTSNNN